MAEVTIRPEVAGDASAIRSVTEAAFRGTPYSDGTEAKIVDQLRADGDLSLSLIACEDGVVTGHVALSPVRIGDRTTGWFGLGPLSVQPGRQRRGIGIALVKGALDWLCANRAAGCVLVGDPGYYARFGFFSDGQCTYAGLDPKFVQRLVLAGPDAQGEITYRPAFTESAERA